MIRVNLLLWFIAIAATAFVGFVQAAEEQSNPLGCLEEGTYLEGVDYFPIKVEPVESAFWDVEYYNTYKVLTNKANNATYLLYQCGTPNTTLPADLSVFNETIEIPITKVSVSQVNTILYLEQLNKVDTVVAYTSDVSYIGSPCLLEAIEGGEVMVVRNATQLDELKNTDFLAQVKLTGIVAFNAPYDVDAPFDITVVTNPENEKTNGAIFEWIKFYGAFFNLESMANEAFAATQDRTECLRETASNIVSTADSQERPTVLWGYYCADPEYCGGWDIGECPNYYCEFAETCSADIIVGTAGVNEGSIDVYGYKYMTMEEFAATGATAEYWIFPGSNWDETYALFKDQLDTFKSVQNQQVYDVQGAGLSAWFEQRYAEYYNVEQNFCSIIGTSNPLNGNRGWFRNVFTEPVGGLQAKQCSDINRTSILPYDSSSCEFLGSPATTDLSNTSTNNTAEESDSANGTEPATEESESADGNEPANVTTTQTTSQSSSSYKISSSIVVTSIAALMTLPAMI